MRGLARAVGRGRVLGLVIVVVALAAMTSANAAMAQVSQKAAGDKRNNNTYQKLTQCIRLNQVRAHQAALQAISDANGGNRFAGLAGHNKSVEYVVSKLEAAGWDTDVQVFDYTAFRILGASALQQTAPGTVTYVEDVDFGVIDQSDSGEVTAAVQAVDLVRPANTTRPPAARRPTSPASPPATSRSSSAAPAPSPQGGERAGGRRHAVIIFNEGTAGAHDALVRHPGCPRHDPRGRHELRRRRRLCRPHHRGPVTAGGDQTLSGRRTTPNVIAERRASNDGQRRHGRRAPRLGSRGPGHQRQRLGQRSHPRWVLAAAATV